MADEKEAVKVDENGERDVERDDLVGGDRSTVGLRERDEVGGDGAIDRDRGENETGQMGERVDEEGYDAARSEHLSAHVEVEIGDEDDVAEAESEHDQIDDGQPCQIDECRVFAHVFARKNEETQQVAEYAHDQEHDREGFGKTRVEIAKCGFVVGAACQRCRHC